MTDEDSKSKEDPNSFEEVLKGGKNLLSDIENERELEALRKREEENERKKRERQEEEGRLHKTRLSEENIRAISGTSAIPFYSAINRELLRESGEIFDWSRQTLDTHWHIEEDSYYDGDGDFEDQKSGYAHRLIYFFSGIAVPKKGRIITYIPIEEQTGQWRWISLNDEIGPYYFKKTKSFLGRDTYRKVYSRPEFKEDKFLDPERQMYVVSQSGQDITPLTPHSPCDYRYGSIRISLADDKENIYIQWSQAIVKKIAEIW